VTRKLITLLGGKAEIPLSISITPGRRIMGVLINLHISTVQRDDAPGSAHALCPLNVIVGGTRNQSRRASPA
jgi:hypothetical protein